MMAPMVVIELVLMKPMYKNTNANTVIVAVAVAALGAFFGD
jgi:hypothetical protein